MIYSVTANLLSALMILVYPTLTGFIIAALLRALCFSFWSGTGQAFLDENLHILGERDKFGRVIGRFMAYEQFAALFTPVIAALILKYFGNGGYTILAALDVCFAFVLMLLVFELKEITKSRKFRNFAHIVSANWKVAKSAITNVFTNKKIRLLLIYRSLSHHMIFLSVIALPVLTENGMKDWFSGILITVAGAFGLLGMKYAYKIGEKYSYNLLWVLSSVAQGILLIFIGVVIKSWIAIFVLYIIFEFFYGLWNPSWNHVLVEQTRGKAIATTRSILMAFFALYITIGKQILSFVDVGYALLGLGLFILIVNLILGKKILRLTTERQIIPSSSQKPPKNK